MSYADTFCLNLFDSFAKKFFLFIKPMASVFLIWSSINYSWLQKFQITSIFSEINIYNHLILTWTKSIPHNKFVHSPTLSSI